MDIYQSILRPLLFNLLEVDPESLHQHTIHTLNCWEKNKYLNAKIRHYLCFSNSRLGQKLWGLNFLNPLGLAAGFDKDAAVSNVWSSLGFGFAEMGTVTYYPQLGNPRPRLFRLAIDNAALNRMGFNNSGAEVMAKRLTAQRQKCTSIIPIGINLGKSKVTALLESTTDYVRSFRLLKDLGDYFVVNISSPNTPGLRSLQNTNMLRPILAGLQEENSACKPILIKIAPDLEWEEISNIIDLVQTYQLAGIIATNTTIKREGLTRTIISATGNFPDQEAGGISGAPLRDRSTEIIRFIWQQTKGKIPIIGVGGVFNTDHAWEKITAGASLIQIYTGWVYEGPFIVSRILQGLVSKLDQHGLHSISDAIGYQSR